MSKLLMFGDSVLKGASYDDKSGKYCMTDTREFKRLCVKKYEIFRFSHIGRTVEYGLCSVMKKAELITGNSDVLLSYGGNDCNYDWQAISDNPEGTHYPKSTADDFIGTYVKCIEFCRSRGAVVYVTNLAPLDPNKFLGTISAGRSKENILKWLGEVTALSRWQEYYSLLATQAAIEAGARLIDIRTGFLTSHEFDSLVSSDGIHPTQKGHIIIENAIEDAILSESAASI